MVVIALIRFSRLKQLLTNIGPLRVIVAVLALALVPIVFLQSVNTQPWALIFQQVVPGLVFFLIWSIPFDMLMARVFMSDTAEPERARYRQVIKVDFIVWLLLAIFWGLFFVKLLSDR